MIKFITGYSGYGGSTIMLIQHCELLYMNGFESELYGPQEWHMNRSDRSRMIEDISFDSEDILIYHFCEPSNKPTCKKSFLFLQETSLYDLHSKPVQLFDEILFVSEEQRKWHGFLGQIIPNRMNGLVDPSKHNPPNKKIAGIVGNLHPIKNTDASIRKAMDDGMDEILLFGPIIDGMDFKSYLSKYISRHDERVKYMGQFDPSERMTMYNSFDVLYHFGEFESACLTLGECRILGKPVVKSENLFDYPILNDEEILDRWLKLIR